MPHQAQLPRSGRVQPEDDLAVESFISLLVDNSFAGPGWGLGPALPLGSPTEQPQSQEYFLEEVSPSFTQPGQQELVRPKRAGRVLLQKEQCTYKTEAQRQEAGG